MQSQLEIVSIRNPTKLIAVVSRAIPFSAKPCRSRSSLAGIDPLDDELLVSLSARWRRFPMFMFGMRCIRCNHEIIAPHKSEFLDNEVIRHLWHCPCCKAIFESIPRFPANAKLVKEVTMSVEVFPPLNDLRDI
jgi:hypothetical protein